ncbi:hypothetical protein [Nevskia ramosa]|uniref:hypothetical protein n=1 Tax=Nevskia ramosa TaxID=64002 RepID=UPI003D1501E3
MNRHLVMILAATFLLSGCAVSDPRYVLPANAPSARINVNTTIIDGKAPYVWLCNSSPNVRAMVVDPSDPARAPAGSPKVKELILDSSGYVRVPAGERLIVGTGFLVGTYGNNLSCAPRSSFVPKAGKEYYLDFEIEAEHCTAFIYQIAPSRPAGLAFESSLQPGGTCPIEK